jgi:opacity protein-like surface antigen
MLLRPAQAKVAAAALGVCLVSASSAFAQAWLPPKGEAWFSLSYANMYNRDHYDYAGKTFNSGQVLSNTFLADLGYSITDRLGVRVNLPYATARYSGLGPHLFPVDDGSTHGTFTDLRMEARYNVFNGPVALTPFVATILPSHHYEYFGHAVVGMDLKQLLIGTGFGFRLDSFLPNAYVVGRYSYAFVEMVQNIPHDRSNMELQLGYNVTSSLQLFALGTGLYTHGGTELNLPIVRTKWSAETFHHHAQSGRSVLWAVGGGVNYQLTPTIDVQAGFLKTVAGKNDHSVNSLITAGVTFGFSPRQVIRRMSAPPPASMLAPGL